MRESGQIMPLPRLLRTASSIRSSLFRMKLLTYEL